MRKVVVLLLVMAVLFAGCSPKSVEDACEKADKLVEKWDSQSLNLYRYYAEGLQEINGETVYVLTMKLDGKLLANASAQGIAIQTSYNVVKAAIGTAVEELEELFENFEDVKVGIVIYDHQGNLSYTYYDGNLK